ncbi:MAG: T9SS type A sorting domain-containing protein [FCB group bacterium]|nr:T9SS type A sorting domain-containing protein [FCB group bacterium]
MIPTYCLALIWMSASDSSEMQAASDILWYDADGNGHQDICTIGHCVFDTTAGGDSLYYRDGKHFLYLADSDGDIDSCTAWTGNGTLYLYNTNDRPAWGTSIAAGDIDGAGLISTTETGILMGSYSYNPCLFYLPHFPAHKIDTVKAACSDGGNDTLIVIPYDSYCFDLVSGWVSISSAALDTLMANANFIYAEDLDSFLISYSYSTELDLIAGDEWECPFYQWGGSDSAAASDELDIDDLFSDLDTGFHYPEHGTDYWGMDEKGAVGIWVTGTPDQAEILALNYPDLNLWRLSTFMGGWHPFFKEFFFDHIDRWVKTALENDITLILTNHGTAPIWMMGGAGRIDGSDQGIRTVNEYLMVWPVNAYVRRYQPSGFYTHTSADTGITIYQFENEPNCAGFGYGTTSRANKAIKDKIYCMYQTVKGVNTNYTVLSPNFSVNSGDSVGMSYLNFLYNDITVGDYDSVLHKYCDVLDFQAGCAYEDSLGNWIAFDPLGELYDIEYWSLKACEMIDSLMNANSDSFKPAGAMECGFPAWNNDNAVGWSIANTGIIFAFPRNVWSCVSEEDLILDYNPNEGILDQLAALNNQAQLLKGYHHYAFDGSDIRVYEDSGTDSVIWEFIYANEDSSNFIHQIATRTDYAGSVVDDKRFRFVTDKDSISDEHAQVDYVNFNSFERQINEDEDSTYAWITFLPDELDSLPLHVTELVSGDDYDITIPLPKNEWNMISLNLYSGTQQCSTIFADVEADCLVIRNFRYYNRIRDDGSWSWSPSNRTFNWDMGQGYAVYNIDDTVHTPAVLEVADEWWYNLCLPIDITPTDEDSTFIIAYTPCWDMTCDDAFDMLFNWPDPGDTVLIWARNSDGVFFIPGADTVQYFRMRQGEGYKLKMASGDDYEDFQFTDIDTTIILESYPGKPDWNKSVIESINGSHFKFRRKTQDAYAIVLVDIEIEGVVPQQGDEIGVFMSDTICVGAVSYQGGGKTIITAWEDEICTPDSVDGYIEGEIMTFKYWDDSDEEEYDLNIAYIINLIQSSPNAYCTACPIFGEKDYAYLNFSAAPDIEIPNSFALHQNYPNPFNPSTVIKLDLPEASNVKLEVYNVLGQRVEVLMDQICSAGCKTIIWQGTSNGGQISSGVYFYHLEASGLSSWKKFKKVNKMMLLK